MKWFVVRQAASLQDACNLCFVQLWPAYICIFLVENPIRCSPVMKQLSCVKSQTHNLNSLVKWLCRQPGFDVRHVGEFCVRTVVLRLVNISPLRLVRVLFEPQLANFTKSVAFLSGFQALPVCRFGQSSLLVEMSFENCWNDTEQGKTGAQEAKPVHRTHTDLREMGQGTSRW